MAVFLFSKLARLEADPGNTSKFDGIILPFFEMYKIAVILLEVCKFRYCYYFLLHVNVSIEILED